jgi:hypothetical protein
MRESEGFVIDVGALLEKVEEAAPIDAVEVVAAELGRMVDAHTVTLLIADFSGRAVVRLTSASLVEGARARGEEQAETLPLAGTLYERVLRTQRADIEAIGDGARMVVPVTDRGDAIGLLELDLPRYPSADEVLDICSAAHALAYVVIAARRHTDVFEWGQRSTPFALAAEIQRRLLPSAYTCEAGQFTLAGWLEPAASVGGDTFDYSLDRDTLKLSITDAVGHQVPAALVATLLVGALRNARRKGLGLADQARYANDALAENAAPGQFVTGQLLQVDLHRGTAVIVNAGHTCRCACETDAWRRSTCASRRRSASYRASRSTCSPSRSSPATGSCSSPTACRSAMPPPSMSQPRWPRASTCTRARSSTSSARRS